MEIRSPSGITYEVGGELGSNKKFKYYSCSSGLNNVYMLKIARKSAWNGLLDREAFLLQTMEKEAQELELEYAKTKKSDKKLNYHFFFPQLIETFISEEQSGSRITILNLAHVAKSIGDLSPVSHLLTKESVIVDPRTSAWILGKLLTALSFTKGSNIFVKDLSGDNILINRSQHYVTILDWTEAILSNAEIPKSMVSEMISQAATEIFTVMGGDLKTKALPKHQQLDGNLYESHLKNMMAGYFSDVSKAHKAFYDIVLSAWPREFYKFTTIITT